MNILILGGTQFVGKHIVDAFSDSNHNITLFNRGTNTTNTSVKYLQGDRILRDFSNLENTEWDVVIDIPYFETDVVKDTLDFLYDKTDLYIFMSSIIMILYFGGAGIVFLIERSQENIDYEEKF